MANKPNIVIVMTDQQRADVSAREGFPLDTTPFLDRLAARGTWFNRAYTAAPVCSPARVSLLTGRFPSTHRVRENSGQIYATYEKDILDVLKEQGYKTGLFGKNHSHADGGRWDCAIPGGRNSGFASAEERTSLEAEFDVYIRKERFATGMAPTPYPLECQRPYRSVTHAIRWIQSLREHDQDQPFFTWISFIEPHNPYHVPEPYFSMFPQDRLPPTQSGKEVLEEKGFKWQFARKLVERPNPDYELELPRARANYFGMLRMIDDQVKRFYEFLQVESLLNNTIFIFMSDHGDYVGEYGLIRKGAELPDILMRVPLFFVGPGIQASSHPHAAHVSLVDVFPTLCEAIGTSLPRGVQGRSLWPMLTGQPYPEHEFDSVYGEQGYGGLHYTWDDEIDYDQCSALNSTHGDFDELNTYSQSGTMRMVRKGDWKLNYDMMGRGQLYNVKEDFLELNNLYNKAGCEDIQREMLAELLTWTLRMQDPLPYPRVKYVMKTDPRNYWTPHL
ncbi:MAG: sulfatase-like hydrolase/transferase [Paenibacillaceae bacterium]|jgi:arylsulfatase A-like enzyme|nr:sulfatase-like hydrolase/transferase [Paenibacillaceae bacterium]